jgi:hypothetical protein
MRMPISSGLQQSLIQNFYPAFQFDMWFPSRNSPFIHTSMLPFGSNSSTTRPFRGCYAGRPSSVDPSIRDLNSTNRRPVEGGCVGAGAGGWPRALDKLDAEGGAGKKA